MNLLLLVLGAFIGAAIGTTICVLIDNLSMPKHSGCGIVRSAEVAKITERLKREHEAD